MLYIIENNKWKSLSEKLNNVSEKYFPAMINLTLFIFLLFILL